MRSGCYAACSEADRLDQLQVVNDMDLYQHDDQDNMLKNVGGKLAISAVVLCKCS